MNSVPTPDEEHPFRAFASSPPRCKSNYEVLASALRFHWQFTMHGRKRATFPCYSARIDGRSLGRELGRRWAFGRLPQNHERWTMSTGSIRLRGWNALGKPMDFIYIVRGNTGVGLLTAKSFLDQLRAGATICLGPLPTTYQAVRMGEELLARCLVEHAELILDDEQSQPISAPPLPPDFLCPSCREKLKHRSECAACGWLDFPSDRQKWGLSGACPRCGFTYHFDGSRCSHCGHGSSAAAV